MSYNAETLRLEDGREVSTNFLVVLIDKPGTLIKTGDLIGGDAATAGKSGSGVGKQIGDRSGVTPTYYRPLARLDHKYSERIDGPLFYMTQHHEYSALVRVRLYSSLPTDAGELPLSQLHIKVTKGKVLEGDRTVADLSLTENAGREIGLATSGQDEYYRSLDKLDRPYDSFKHGDLFHFNCSEARPRKRQVPIKQVKAIGVKESATSLWSAATAGQSSSISPILKTVGLALVAGLLHQTKPVNLLEGKKKK